MDKVFLFFLLDESRAPSFPSWKRIKSSRAREIWNIREELMQFKSAGYLLKKKEKILENWKTNILWQVSSELCIV